MNVNLTDIYVDPHWNCRGAFLLHDVHELGQLMQQHGLIQAVVLQPASRTHVPTGQPYKLIAGFRRFAAAQLLQWDSIPAVVKEVDDDEARSINLIENLERKDLNVLQQAQAMERQYPRARYTLREIAQKLKRHTAWVQERWHLLKLPEEVQAMFASGRLPLSRMDFVRNAPDVVQAAQDALKRKQVPLGRPAAAIRARRQRKSDVNRLIIRLIDLGLEGLPTRVLAWANGHVSTEELEHDISQVVASRR